LLEEDAVVGDFSRVTTKCVSLKITNKDAGNAALRAALLLVRAMVPVQAEEE
jgi:hypothetical protein